ncbi:MAG: alanine acetyltransferase, partial [Myxococcota bacterium]
MPPPSEAPRMVGYVERNRRHLGPWEPRHPDVYYTRAFWEDRLEENRNEYARDRSMRLVLFERGKPDSEVVGVANFTSIIRGAFHACL